MALDEKTVRKVATLARIRITDEEVARYGAQLNNILGFVEHLAEVDTGSVEPLPSPVNIALRLRRDEITDGGCPEDVLANAPEEMEGFYVVSKIVE